MATLNQMLGLAEDFAKLGWSVQDQAAQAIRERDFDSLNANALRKIVEWLRQVDRVDGAEDGEAGDLADEIEAYLES